MNQTSNQLKIVSFLGFNKYHEVSYLHPDYQHNQREQVTFDRTKELAVK